MSSPASTVLDWAKHRGMHGRINMGMTHVGIGTGGGLRTGNFLM
jgi:hypothetical protein